MPRYLAKNYLNELLQSFQSTVACLLISEEMPRLELAAHDAAQQSLVSNFISSHPWLQDKIEFTGLNLTGIQIREEVQRLPVNTSSAISHLFERESEWCLLKNSQFHDACSRRACCLTELCNCCPSVAQPQANNWMDAVRNTADADVLSQQFILEAVLMDSYGSRGGRLPLASQLVRRLKPAVVPDPLFGQNAIPETLIFKDEIAPSDLLQKRLHTLDHCTELFIEDEHDDVNGMESQNLVLEEPMTLRGWEAADGPRLQMLLLLLEPLQSVLDEFHDEFNSAEDADHREEELSNSTKALSSVVAPIEFLSKSPSENGQLTFIMMNQILGDAAKREAFLWLESPLLNSCSTTDRCNSALCPGDLALEEEEEEDVEEEAEEEEAEETTTTERLLLSCEPSAPPRFLLNKLSEAEILAELWQNEKYFDEIQLLAVRECRLESVTCDDSLKLMSVWSAVATLSLTSEEITSTEELDLAWDPLQASYHLMAATEKNQCMEPVMQHSSSCPGSLLDCSSAADDAHQRPAESSGNGAQHQSPFLQPPTQTVKTFQQTNVRQNVAEAGQCVYRHLDNFSRKHQAPSTTPVSDSSSHSRSSREMSKLELLDPLDQFLMLRKAPAAAAASKGPASSSVTTTVEGQANPVGGVGSSSSLVAVVQPRVNTASAASAAAASEPSSNPVPVLPTVLDASSSDRSVFPTLSSGCSEAESKNITNSSASTVINISLTASSSVDNLLRLLEAAAHPYVALLRRHRILVSEQNFSSLQSDVMGFIVKQQQNDFSAITDVDVDLRMDLLRAAICVHCLVSAHDHLMHSSLSSAAQVLSLMQARNQQILGSVLDDVQQKVLLEQVRHSRDGILHPKALEMCHVIRQFRSTYSRTDSNDSKILVILPPCDSHDVTMSVGHYLLETLTSSVEKIRPVLLSSSSSLLPTDNRFDAYNCYVVASNHLTDKWPWTEFALVIEYSFSLSSTYKEKCLLVKVPFVGLRSNKEIFHLTNDDDDDDESVDEVISRSSLRQMSIVMSRDLTAKHKELIHLLEARYNVVVTERDYANLLVSGYFEDMTVGGSTVIVIEDLMVLRRKQEMERLVMRVSGLKQKSIACWILVFSSNHHHHHHLHSRSTAAADSSDLYSTNIIINISKLQASFGVLAKPDFQIKVVFCHSYNSMAIRIRQIASNALSCNDSSSSSGGSGGGGQMKTVVSSWPTIEPTQDERFLLSVPSLNSISAQMMLRIGSLKTLLTLSKPELLERSSSSLPNKIIQAFLEFRESVGEIFLILKHAQCRGAGQNLLLSISPQSNDNDSSSSEKNRCLPWSPHNVATTCASSRRPMSSANRTDEGMDKEEEEEDLRNADHFKTHCLSSPKLNDFQEAEMFGKNFAAFLSSLKSDLSDDMRLGTEEEEKERFAVHFDYNDVHQIDLNPVHHVRSVETDGGGRHELDSFSFTDHSAKSSDRIPLLSRRDETKWRSGGNHVQYHRDGVALRSTTDAPTTMADNTFKTYNEEEDDLQGDKIYDSSNVLHAEERFFSNGQEIEEEFLPFQRQTAGLTDGLTVTQLPNVGIDRTRNGRGNDPETDYVDCRRFRQPVQSLTLDDNNSSDQKSNRNFWSHARSSRSHSFGHRWPFQQSSSPAYGASIRKRKLTFERDDATKSGQTKLKFI